MAPDVVLILLYKRVSDSKKIVVITPEALLHALSHGLVTLSDFDQMHANTITMPHLQIYQAAAATAQHRLKADDTLHERHVEGIRPCDSLKILLLDKPISHAVTCCLSPQHAASAR